MRNLFLFVLSATLLVSCAIELEDQNDTKILNQTSSERIENQSIIEYLIFDNVAYFIDDSSQGSAYFVKFTEPLNYNFKDYSDINYSYDEATLTFSNSLDNYLTLELGESIYGIGFLSVNIANMMGLVQQSGNDTFILNPNFPEYGDNPEPILCNCFENATSLPSNCHAGGVGATDCTISNSGLFGFWDNSCSVNCGNETIACCTRDAEWKYE